MPAQDSALKNLKITNNLRVNKLTANSIDAKSINSITSGPIGPTGPTGPSGATGPTGPSSPFVSNIVRVFVVGDGNNRFQFQINPVIHPQGTTFFLEISEAQSNTRIGLLLPPITSSDEYNYFVESTITQPSPLCFLVPQTGTNIISFVLSVGAPFTVQLLTTSTGSNNALVLNGAAGIGLIAQKIHFRSVSSQWTTLNTVVDAVLGFWPPP